MTPATVTAVFIAFVVGAVLLYDLAAILLVGPEASISHVVKTWALRWRWVPAAVAVGMVLLWVHWFGGE